MTTIIIADGITATMTLTKVEQYRKAMEADRSACQAARNDNLDWEDLEDFWNEAADAWERFFS